SVFDSEILSLDVTERSQTLSECLHIADIERCRLCLKHADPKDLVRLCESGKRPRSRRAAEQRYELPPLHSITSSARPSIAFGMVWRSALAVWRLINSSPLVPCWTVKSVGLWPRRPRQNNCRPGGTRPQSPLRNSVDLQLRRTGDCSGSLAPRGG